jgi:hypothetical protein
MYPFDRALALAPGRTQLDVQQAAAQVAIEMPYEEAQTLFSDLTGVALGSERLHTFVHQAAEGQPFQYAHLCAMSLAVETCFPF